ncbi:central kinetochore subunit Mal2/MCM21 [Sporothrix schenckii 1099-18]|uniref:Cenp-O kinetochore centromere component n=2 Tax=Sporothrix schenckii TaxID=29908 RepID=U7PX52_SPOS1|nr:central kinetochore subunit Mal2/MCM21 [Sporothrix schenckii 1099-18]ERS99496.1 hypothetical protein HMPREF1624_04696 [Sporothrix schenckii ATCC 58251]KJR82772.1 central kinetochore subunit Mal2/MCM21 [Sporothrix schenckii 1099-18]
MASTLDDEIEQLRERAADLRKQLQVQTSTLLSASRTRQILNGDSHRDAATRKKLLKLCNTHDAHKQQGLYRAGASVTAFRVRDPDPNAVDGGRVLGLRFDVMMGAQFLRPYYVLLNRDTDRARPSARSRGQSDAQAPLRVHRHTVPPSVPLGGLATRHLGATQYAPSGPKSPDLYGFARAARRALVRYHNRLAVIGDLRKSVQQRASKVAAEAASSGVGIDASTLLADVSGADAEAKQIRFDWADGRTGRLVLDDDGDIQKMVVIGATGARDRAAVRALLAGEKTAMGLVQRMSGS